MAFGRLTSFHSQDLLLVNGAEIARKNKSVSIAFIAYQVWDSKSDGPLPLRQSQSATQGRYGVGFSMSAAALSAAKRDSVRKNNIWFPH